MASLFCGAVAVGGAGVGGGRTPERSAGSVRAGLDADPGGSWGGFDPTASTWQTESDPPTFEDVACPTSRTCYAVGGGAVGGGEVWATSDGRDWSVVYDVPAQDGTSQTLDQVACWNATACVAAGSETNPAGTSYALAVTTTDSGATWSSATFAQPGSSARGVSCPSATLCVVAGNAYYEGASSTFVATSDDGGQTWSAGDGPAGEVELDSVTCPSDDDCLMTAASQASSGGGIFGDAFTQYYPDVLYQSSDGGNTWTAESGLAAGTIFAGGVSCWDSSDCAVMTTPGATYYGIASSGLTHTSASGGASGSWDASGSASPGTNDSLDTGWVYSLSCTSASDCFVAGDTTEDESGVPPTVTAVVPFLDQTTDAGAAWSAVTLPQTSEDQLAPYRDGAFDDAQASIGVDCAAGTATCMLATSGGVSATENGERWVQEVVAPADLADVTCVGQGTCYALAVTAGPTGNTVVKTTTGGALWQATDGELGTAIADPDEAALACLSATTCFVDAPDWSGANLLAETTDGGGSWATASTSLPADPPYGASCAVSSCVYSLGSGGLLTVSTSTTATSSLGGGDVSAVSCVSGTGDCVALSSGTVYTSSDGGWTWSAGASLAGVDELSCPSTGFCLAVGYGVDDASSDGGSSWTAGTAPEVDSGGQQLACISPAVCWEIGSGGSGSWLYQTTDGGGSWSDALTPVDDDGWGLESIACLAGDACYAAGAGSDGDNAVIASTAPFAAPIGGALTIGELLGGDNADEGCLACELSALGLEAYVGDPVDTATGDVVEQATDVSLPGLGGGLSLTRTYDADLAQEEVAAGSGPGPFGYGWSSNWTTTSLEVNTPGTGQVTAVTGTGASVVFSPSIGGLCQGGQVQAGSGFCAAPRVEATLSYNAGPETYTLVQMGVETYTFSASGALVSLFDRWDNTTTVASGTPAPGTGDCPSGAASCETITAPSGRAIVLAFDSGGQVTSVTGPLGRTTAYAYCTSSTPGYGTDCSSGDLVSVTDPLGRVTSYGYDTEGVTTDDPSSADASLAHELISLTSPAGQSDGVSPSSAAAWCSGGSGPPVGEAVFCDDSAGRASETADAMGLVTTYAYSGSALSPEGGTTTVTDPHGNETVFDYVYGELVQSTTGAGTAAVLATIYVRDPASLLASAVVDPQGNTTTFTFDAEGHVLTETDPLGETTSYCYNASGRDCGTESDPFGSVYQVTPPLGPATEMTYDATGDLTSTTLEGSPQLETEDAYYADGELACAVSATEVAKGVSCDETHPDPPDYTWTAGTTLYTYDSAGDLSLVKDADGNVTSDSSDADGELYCSVSPKVSAEGGVSCPEPSGSWSAGLTWDVYDADGELTSSENADGDTTQYAYDADGNEDLVIDPSGNETETIFDDDDRPESGTSAYGSSSASTTTHAYDIPDGTAPCTASIAGASYCTTTTEQVTSSSSAFTVDYYDASNELVGEVRPAGAAGNGTTTYAYNLVPQPSGSSCSSSVAGASYCDTTTNGAGTTTDTFDGDGRLIEVTDSSGSPSPVSYGYNADSERTQMSDGSGTTTYGYDTDGRLRSVTDGAGETTTYGYCDDVGATVSAPGLTHTATGLRAFASICRPGVVTAVTA